MAYSKKFPPKVIVPRKIPDDRALWIYMTNDDPETVATAGYFSNGANLDMQVGDVVFVVNPIGQKTSIMSVYALSGASASVSAGAVVGSSNLQDGSVTTAKLDDGSVTTQKVDDDAITNAKLRDSAANSVIGRASNSAGDPADIQASTEEDVLVLRDGSVQFAGLHKQTAAEIAAGVTPVNYQYPPGDVRRYGTNTTPGTTDMTAAIQAACDVAHEGGGTVFVPKGIYAVSDQIVIPPTSFAEPAVLIVGEGRSNTIIRLTSSLSAGEAVFVRDETAGTAQGGGIRDMTVDANKNADYVVRFHTGRGTSFRGGSFINARVAEGYFGAATGRFYETDFVDSWWRTESSDFTDPDDRPDYNLVLTGNATDNEIKRVTAANASVANILIEAGGNAVIGAHTYGSPSTFEADYGIQVNTANVRVVGSFMDGFGVAGLYSSGLGGVVSVGNLFYWPNTDTADGHLIGDGQFRIHIEGNTYAGLPAGKKRVAFAGSLPQNSQILDGLVSGNGESLVIGSTNVAGELSAAAVQVLGTSFATAQVAIGKWSADSQPPYLTFFKSRGTSIGANVIVASADILGAIDFGADDGVNKESSARIQALVTGTPGEDDVPGQFRFYTRPAAGSLTERLRITSGGDLLHREGNTTIVDANSHLGLRSYTVGTLPSAAAAGRMIYVSDGTSNKRMAVSDGTNWRFPDGATVS